MAKKRVEAQITHEEEETLDSLDLQGLIGDASDLEEGADDTPAPDPEPSMSDPEWPGFVMRQFQNEELDPNSRPKVGGLRRVARKLLGPILKSNARVVSAPQFLTNTEIPKLSPATVEHHIEILLCRPADVPDGGINIEATEVATAYHAEVNGLIFSNISDANVRMHLTEAASTKAESRALRKLLLLTDGIASEEDTLIPAEEAAQNGKVTPSQISFLRVVAERSGVDLEKFIHWDRKNNRMHIGKERRWESLSEVPAEVASHMATVLGKLQKGELETPDFIKKKEK